MKKLTQMAILNLATTLIQADVTAKRDFAEATEKMGIVYAMRHQTERACVAEYGAKLGHNLKAYATMPEADFDLHFPDALRDLNTMLRGAVNGGMDGEYQKYEAKAIANLLNKIDNGY